MALDVKVKIDLTQPVGSVGFGVPLIYLENAATTVDYTECTSLADVKAAGFAETDGVYKAAQTLLIQENAPAKFAVCANISPAETWVVDVANSGKDWRQLIVISGSGQKTDVSKVMAAIETLDNKVYFADVAVDDDTTYTVSGINRTVLFYCDASGETFPAAALVGATAGLGAGSFTYKNMILAGIKPQALTDTQINAIHAKGGITFVTKAGDNVTTEGKLAGGEYIDVVDSQDYIISNLEYQTQKTLNTMPKIPYDNNGIAILESVAVNVMKDAYNQGIIASNEDGTPAYTVSYAKREDTTASDRAVRKYIGGQFAFTLAGAIHTVEVTGEIII